MSGGWPYAFFITEDWPCKFGHACRVTCSGCELGLCAEYYFFKLEEITEAW